MIDKDGTVLASITGTPDATVRSVLALLDDSASYDPAAGAEVVKDVVHDAARHDNKTSEGVDKAKIAAAATVIASQLGANADRTTGEKGVRA